MTTYKIALIPGDGIGKEVVPEGVRVLDAAAAKFGFEFQWDDFDWSCEMYHQTGAMMPEDGLDQIRGHDAVYLGAAAHQRGRRGDGSSGLEELTTWLLGHLSLQNRLLISESVV